MIKMSELADRKNHHQDQDRQNDQKDSSRGRRRDTYTPEKRPKNNLDYNALDYEDQSDREGATKKQVC